MKRLRIGFFLALTLVFVQTCIAADFDAYVYWVSSGTRKVISWEPSSNAVGGYELYVWKMENSKIMYQTVTTNTSITINWRTPGHYIIYVRGYEGDGSARQYSEWKNTLDPTVGQVDGKPKAWVLCVPVNY